MQTTTNYDLKKYESGDYFNPLTVNNSNLDEIDTNMKAISDRAIGRATELVSQGVHAITLLDTDCKTFKFVATGNYTAGETFTVNGIQCNAYTPSGSALTSNAFVTGSIVLGTLNEDGTAITFYITGSAVADDSLKLGGELPSYYATQSDMTNAETDITNLKNQAGNTSIVGIGDGTLSGAISSINQKFNEVSLWTNSAPNSAFNAQTVPLDLTNVKQLRVRFIQSRGVAKISDITLENTVGFFKYANSLFSNVVRWREVSVSSTGVTFDNGYSLANWTTPSTDNETAIPLEILAVY